MSDMRYTAWTLVIAADAADGALLLGRAGRGIAKAVLDTVTRDAAGDGRMALATEAPPQPPVVPRALPQHRREQQRALERLCADQQEHIRTLTEERDALRRVACDILDPFGPLDSHVRLARLVLPGRA